MEIGAPFGLRRRGLRRLDEDGPDNQDIEEEEEEEERNNEQLPRVLVPPNRHHLDAFFRPRAPPDNRNNNQNQGLNNDSPTPLFYWKRRQWYCFVSSVLAMLAIVMSPAGTPDSNHSSSTSATTARVGVVFFENTSSISSSSSLLTSQRTVEMAKAAAVSVNSRKKQDATSTTPPSSLDEYLSQLWGQPVLSSSKPPPLLAEVIPPSDTEPPSENTKQKAPHPVLKWLFQHDNKQPQQQELPNNHPPLTFYQYCHSWLDPTLLQPSSTTIPDILDKLLTSSPRLLMMANFLLSLTYLLHAGVAAWFLGDDSAVLQSGDAHGNWSAATARARERMGGFLVFKLLLISAVVAPDTLDWVILLTWYTSISCLRSLDQLCHATTTHSSAASRPPPAGVWQLLTWILVCDLVSAACCAALFHAAGWGMVLLLTCDCALLATDVLVHLFQHIYSVWEHVHAHQIQRLEQRQSELHNASYQNNNNNNNNHGMWERRMTDEPQDEQEQEEDHEFEGLHQPQQQDEQEDTTMLAHDSHNIYPSESHEAESRQLDRRMETLELAHARRLAILDTAIFGLELLCHVLTVAHFLHIWSLHGVQFTLIDGVLALHLHSALSSACKKIAQRRNLFVIARDLHGMFPDASEQELRKASLAGDVCCICLGTMSTGISGHVKKVHCGHLYHTHCLREVVERAQSMQAAKCPLCRASVVDGRPYHTLNTNTSTRNNNANRNVSPEEQQVPPLQPPPPPPLQAPLLPPPVGEHALFRFSTDNILPAWLPVPAFSFEVVRRRPPLVLTPPPIPPVVPLPPVVVMPPASENNENLLDDIQNNDIYAFRDTNANANVDELVDINVGQAQAAPAPANPDEAQQHQQQNQPSFFRRFLIMAGAIPMSPEEEGIALEQLVDMFPQYDRSDLLRELRERGSAEAVVETVLMGIFTGVPRGD